MTSLPGLLEAVATVQPTASDAYPAANMASLQAAGLTMAPLPPAQGGCEITLEQAVDIITSLAARSPDLALILSMPLGLAGGVLNVPVAMAPADWQPRWSTQVDEVANAFRAGQLFAACNSEKGAGGSLAATKTTAVRQGDGWTLSGEKILASGGTNATTFFSTAKVTQEDLPGAGVVEWFLAGVHDPGVTVLDDWDGFGMRATESQTVRYEAAPARLLGFPNFLEIARPVEYWFCLFAAIPLGCARAVLQQLGDPAPSSPAMRLRLSEALMRYESLSAYLRETARGWQHGAPAAYRARVMRTKTYVAEQSVRLAAELFALGGGRHYRREDPAARAMASAFAGTALRPPLTLGLDTIMEQFDLAAALATEPA